MNAANPANPARVVTLVIDAAAMPLRSATPLFPADGEYARTVAALAGERNVLSLVPDRVVLSIYTSELAERLREQVRRASAAAVADGNAPLTLHAPFWPDLLFHAADEPVHPAREVARLWPKLDAILFVERDLATLRAASLRILGGVRFDLARYRSSATDFASVGHFERIGS